MSSTSSDSHLSCTHIHVAHFFFYLSLPPSSNETFDQGDTVSLDDSKKFKIININQATFLDGPGNKFEHKAQLIEIDKLLINTSSGPKQNKASLRIGVWHQVSSLFFFLYFSISPPAPKTFPCLRLSHLMNVAVLSRRRTWLEETFFLSPA
jgi:hypothetical protein